MVKSPRAAREGRKKDLNNQRCTGKLGSPAIQHKFTQVFRCSDAWLRCRRRLLRKTGNLACQRFQGQVSPALLLGGSWLVTSITHNRGLITPLTTTHEPPSGLQLRPACGMCSATSRHRTQSKLRGRRNGFVRSFEQSFVDRGFGIPTKSPALPLVLVSAQTHEAPQRCVGQFMPKLS